MDVFDRLAFVGRRYEQQTVTGTVRREFTLHEVLQMFGRSAILELTRVGSGGAETLRPDPVRKMKVSLLDDGLSVMHAGETEWYEVLRTAPSGDLSKVRIIEHSRSGEKLGELRLLIGRRSYEHYFEEDPIFRTIAEQK